MENAADLVMEKYSGSRDGSAVDRDMRNVPDWNAQECSRMENGHCQM